MAKQTKPVAPEKTATKRKLPTLKELEARGFRVVRGSGRAYTLLGENFVSSLRRAAAKPRSGGSE